ncbi:helix-turn-helix domain-containing protein [Halobellus sp. EA9]|uniref:helix-turn-helix domain-containing protein n=1 Tax=Halobellus sp. EA9 TaxID=3421647 RepID=UPI003EB7625C
MKQVQFSIEYPDRLRHPLHRAVVDDGSVSRAELLMWSPTADATTLLWFDADPDAVRAVLSAIESLAERSLVRDGGGTYAFLSQAAYEFPDPVLEVVADAAVIFVPPVVFSSSGPVNFEAVGEAPALSDLRESLSALGAIEIERVRPFARSSSPSRLTERQAAALDAAVSVGYYEVPRTGSIEDVAAALDCATSTAGELVRKAESAVLREYAERE